MYGFDTRFIVGVAPQKCNDPTTKIQLVVGGCMPWYPGTNAMVYVGHASGHASGHDTAVYVIYKLVPSYHTLIE